MREVSGGHEATGWSQFAHGDWPVAPEAVPFMKCLGGKRRLFGRMRRLLPPRSRVRRLVERFAGGGAFMLGFRRGLPGQLVEACSDRWAAWVSVQRDPRAVIELVRQHLHTCRARGRDYFFLVRDQDPRGLPLIEQGARAVFLLKTAFNGVLRYSSEGRLNSPFGTAQGVEVDARVFLLASDSLRDVEILGGDFGVGGSESVEEGDLVYLDPPYVPASDTASFVQYADVPWVDSDHDRCAAFARACVDRGAYVLVSNADVPRVREMYRGFQVHEVSVGRPVARKVGGQVHAAEVFLTSYDIGGVS